MNANVEVAREIDARKARLGRHLNCSRAGQSGGRCVCWTGALSDSECNQDLERTHLSIEVALLLYFREPSSGEMHRSVGVSRTKSMFYLGQ